MDGVIVDPLAPVSASAETEDDPSSSTDSQTIVPTEKAKKSKAKSKSQKSNEPLEPTEEAVEGEEEETEAAAEPVSKPVKQ